MREAERCCRVPLADLSPLPPTGPSVRKERWSLGALAPWAGKQWERERSPGTCPACRFYFFPLSSNYIFLSTYFYYEAFFPFKNDLWFHCPDDPCWHKKKLKVFITHIHKLFCNYVWWCLVTRLIAIISQCLQISNHSVVHLKLMECYMSIVPL